MNGDWFLRGRDGRLSVYQLSGDAVRCRAEREPGGPWTAPRTVGGDQSLHPVLAIGQGADGYAHLVSWRPTVKGESGLVHSTHFRPRLSALDWHPIGHPLKKGDRTGTPAVAVDAQGRAHVFVPDGQGGVRLLTQKEKGGWAAWRDLKGDGVRDGLAAVTGESGRVELYAAGPDGIQYWRQEEPAAEPVPAESLRATVRPGTLHALATSPDSTTLYYTDTSGDLCAWRPGGKPVTLLPSAGHYKRQGLGSALRPRRPRLHPARPALGGRPRRLRRLPDRTGVGGRLVDRVGSATARGRTGVADDGRGRPGRGGDVVPVDRPTPADPPQGRTGPRTGGVAAGLNRRRGRRREERRER